MKTTVIAIAALLAVGPAWADGGSNPTPDPAPAAPANPEPAPAPPAPAPSQPSPTAGPRPTPASRADANAVRTDRAGLVTVSSRGADVRNVIHDMFEQSEKSYVLEPNIRFFLYLNLSGVEFHEALQLVCRLANLDYEVQNGIFFIGRAAPRSTQAPTAVKAAAETRSGPAVDPKIVPANPRPAGTPPPPTGTLTPQHLNRRLTTRLPKVDLRALMVEIARQTGVTIEVAPEVPAYRLDAFLIDTSLKYALDTITHATGLTYRLTNHQSVRIEVKPVETSRVQVVP
ncbi:MAG: hypothetical protein SNJ74_08460 [Fimbriimonadaceae bacterium]